jgi:hypothetical protein
MCIGAPKVQVPDAPVIPQAQARQLPDEGATGLRADYLARRRRGLAATILTGPSGMLGVPSTGTLGGGSA